MKKYPLLTLIFCFFILLFVCFWHLQTGVIATSFFDIIRALFNSDTSNSFIIELRLPRCLVSIMSGALFAASGTLLQALVRNKLAAPDVLGMNAGASLAILLALFLFPFMSMQELVGMAILGAFITFIIIYNLAKVNGEILPMRLLLVGVAVGASLKALEQFLLLNSPGDIAKSLAFLAGTVYGTDYASVFRLLPWTIFLLPLSFLLIRKLDLLWLCDYEAKSLGMNLKKTRLIVFILSVFMSASALMGSGSLGFVGLVAPNIARVVTGLRHQYSLPLSMLIGSILVVLADIIGQNLMPPEEIPVGVMTIILGAPFFLWLLKSNTRELGK